MNALSRFTFLARAVALSQPQIQHYPRLVEYVTKVPWLQCAYKLLETKLLTFLKPKFELTLSIYDLNNVPLASGTSFVKWHLPSSPTADHRGRTPKIAIHEHTVTWDYSKTLPVRLTMDKSNMLTELLIHFEIVQDYSSGVGRSEKITLGNIQLNLAEYVDIGMQGGNGEGDDEGVVRRYLMQDSKINSTLKIGIGMKQIDGERNFIAPPLRTAPVFGGIAGIMGQEAVEGEDLGHMPSINRSREAGELQDMYRKSLAAYWASQAGELPADQCIEDIFSGGDGWRSKDKLDKVPQPRQRLIPGHHEDEGDDYERWNQSHLHPRHHHHHNRRRSRSASSTGSKDTIRGSSVGADMAKRVGRRSEHIDMRGHTHGGHIEGHHGHGHGHRPGSSYERDHLSGFWNAAEVNEFDLRSDLMSWQLPGMKEKDKKDDDETKG